MASALKYKLKDGIVGAPDLYTAGDTTQRYPLGHIAEGEDPTYGLGEFVYVKFTGTVAEGDLVRVDRYNKTATQSATAAAKGNFGIAMAAQVNGSYGWVMIRGVHDVANFLTAATVDGLAYGSAITAGRLTNAVTANYIIDGIVAKTVGAANLAVVEVYWPVCSGR